MTTVDTLRCQRDHVIYLAERGARWIPTVMRYQPSTVKARCPILPRSAERLTSVDRPIAINLPRCRRIHAASGRSPRQDTAKEP